MMESFIVFKMHFPAFETEGSSVISAYTEFYAQHERTYIAHRNGGGLRRYDAASKLVGQTCVGIAAGRPDSDYLLYIAADDIHEKLPDNYVSRDQDPQQYAAAVMLEHTIQLLQARHDPEEIAVERQVMHFALTAILVENIRTADEMQRQNIHNAFKTHPSEWEKLQRHRTVIDELTTTALFSRTAHPERLVMPALPHHNASGLGFINYDNLLVQALPDAQPQFYRVQNKASCIGACVSGKSNRLREFREAYTRDIRLISSHCDLGFTYGTTGDNFPMASRIAEEAFGDPSAQTIAILNDAGEALLQTITTDESRRGTAIS